MNSQIPSFVIAFDNLFKGGEQAAFFIFVGIGILLILLGFWINYMAQKAANWPFTKGVVEESYLEDDLDGGSTIRIKYKYYVNEKWFYGTKISYKVMDNSETIRRNFVEMHPVGKKLEVFYNPQNPKMSVIDNEPNSKWVFIVITGIAFIILIHLFTNGLPCFLK